MTFFETTESQKKLARIGQQMMDFSEYYGQTHPLNKLTDEQLSELNELSHVGNMLTYYGAPFGTSRKDFSDKDMQLIARFMKKTLDTQNI
jgi:hypothetical protein